MSASRKKKGELSGEVGKRRAGDARICRHKERRGKKKRRGGARRVAECWCVEIKERRRAKKKGGALFVVVRQEQGIDRLVDLGDDAGTDCEGRNIESVKRSLSSIQARENSPVLPPSRKVNLQKFRISRHEQNGSKNPSQTTESLQRTEIRPRAQSRGRGHRRGQCCHPA